MLVATYPGAKKMASSSTMSGFKIMWQEHRVPTIILAICSALVLGVMLNDAINQYQQNARYDKIDDLRSKSAYHDKILGIYLHCVRDDKESESACITNTIQLADLNGYRDKIKGVFDDAHIPSH